MKPRIGEVNMSLLINCGTMWINFALAEVVLLTMYAKACHAKMMSVLAKCSAAA